MTRHMLLELLQGAMIAMIGFLVGAGFAGYWTQRRADEICKRRGYSEGRFNPQLGLVCRTITEHPINPDESETPR